MTFESNDLKGLHGQNEDKKKSTIKSKSVLSWVLAVLLVLLVSLVTVQFLYPFTIIERIFLQSNTTPPTDEVEKQDLTFSLNPSHLCESDNGVDLLMVVTSEAGHSDRRNMIRKTWGSVANSSGDYSSTVRLAFVVGDSADAAEAAAVAKESATHGDLIRATDAGKAVTMLSWVASHCAEARYFLKAEDDTFVNVDVVARLLGMEPFASHPKFIGGYVMQTYTNEQAPPVSEPCLGDGDYISGPAFLTRGPTAADLFASALALQQQPAADDHLHNEDLFISLCGRGAGAVLLHEPLFAFEAPANCSIEDCGKMAAAPGLTPFEMSLLWEGIQRAMMEGLVLDGGMFEDELDGLETVPVSISVLM